MCRIQNVIRKDGTYYFRRLIRLGTAKPFRLRLSLRTTSHRVARVMGPALSVACENLRMSMIQTIKSDGLSGAERAEIFRRQMIAERDRLEIMHANLQLLGAHGHGSVEGALHLHLDGGEIASLDGVSNGKIEDFLVAHLELDNDDRDIVVMAWSDLQDAFEGQECEDAAAQQLLALGRDTSPLNLAMARKVIHQVRVQAIREFRATLTNPAAAYPAVPVAAFEGFDARLSGSPPVVAPVTNGLRASPEQSEWARLTASEAASRFIEYNPRTGGEDGKARKNGPSWTEKTREQFKLPALLLEQVMEGRPLAAVTHGDLLELNKCFNRLHGPSFRKSERQRNMTIQAIAAETDALVAKKKLAADDVGLGIGTTNRHWGFLRQLTNWFGGHQPIAKLDYSAFIVDDDRDPRTLRDTYTIEEGEQLFRLPPWTGCDSVTRRMAPGTTIIHDACYFVPLIAWYTGLRRGEICAITLADIGIEDGIWYFAIRENEDRRLKTKTSRRDVPMARELLRLGLAEYVQALRSAGETVLFPELRTESGKSDMGDVYYRNWWTRIAARLPFIERGQAIHSFRHTVADELKFQSVDLETRADLAGHKVEGETGGRYAKAARMSVLKQAVDAIPEVTRDLNPAPIQILPAALRTARKARRSRKV